MIRVKPVKT